MTNQGRRPKYGLKSICVVLLLTIILFNFLKPPQATASPGTYRFKDKDTIEETTTKFLYGYRERVPDGSGAFYWNFDRGDKGEFIQTNLATRQGFLYDGQSGSLKEGPFSIDNWQDLPLQGLPPEGQNNGEEDYRELFPGTYTDLSIVNLNDPNKKPPFIRLKGSPNRANKDFIFTLKYVIMTRGSKNIDANWFYFVSTDPNYPNLAILFNDIEIPASKNFKGAAFAVINDIQRPIDDSWFKGWQEDLWRAVVDPTSPAIDKFTAGLDYTVGITFPSYFAVINQFYNNGPYSRDKQPESKHINVEKLKEFGIEGIRIEQSLMDLLTPILESVANLINSALKGIIESIVGVLDHLLIIGNLQKNGAVVKAWGSVRDASNLMLIIGLLLIALANATRFQIEYYTAKALLPRLVIAAIFINFSLFMTQIILDLGNILTSFFMSGAKFGAILPVSSWGGTGALGLTIGLPIALVYFWQIMLVVALVALITLLAILVFRIVLIWLLAIFSPLVFLFSVLPFTRGLTSVWWNYLTKYVFMGAVIAIILRVAADISQYQTTITDAPAPAQQFLTTVAIIVLLIAAALSPIVLGDKLAGAIAGKIGDWTKGLKKSQFARSRGGARIIAGRKFKEKEAGLQAMQRMARSRFKSPQQRAALGAMLMKEYKDRAEHTTKDGRNEYLRRYASLGADGMMHLTNRRGFDKDYLAQAMIQAQSDTMLLNDDKNWEKLTYLNEMRHHMLAGGVGDMVKSTKKNGGYDFIGKEHIAKNAGTSFGQHGSAMRNFQSPEDLAQVGSEYGSSFAHNYNDIENNWMIPEYVSAEDNKRRRLNGAAFKHGLYKVDSETLQNIKIDPAGPNNASNWVKNSGAIAQVYEDERWVDDEKWSGIDGQIRGNITEGSVKNIMQSELSGGKGRKIFGVDEFKKILYNTNRPAYRQADYEMKQYKRARGTRGIYDTGKPPDLGPGTDSEGGRNP